MTMRILSTLLVVMGLGCTAHKMAGARSVIAEQSHCPEPDIFMRELSQGYLGEGCHQSWLCSSSSGPCSKLSCEQVAQQVRQSCRENVERDYRYARSNVEVVMRGIEGVRALDDCALQYDQSMKQCTASPAPSAPSSL
jgi:hypothetical protein